MRLDTEKFPDKIIEKKEAPPKKEFSDIMVDSVAYESAPNAAQARNIACGSGVKSWYSLMLLPDHDRTTQAFPDVMHTTKNAVLAIFDLITGREDTAKVRTTENALQRFSVNPNTVDDQTATASKGK